MNNEGDKYTLGKSKEEYDTIWDLVEAQLDRCLKSTSGDKTVELLYVATWNDKHFFAVRCASRWADFYSLMKACGV